MSEEKRKFDPRSHTIKLPGRKDRNGNQGKPVDYLPVAKRVRWLRDEHPDAHITSQILELTADRAVIQVQVSIPDGGSAMAIGNESKVGFPDYIGKAETVALGRALAILGYGIDFADEFDEQKEEADKRDYEINQANTVKETPPPVHPAARQKAPNVGAMVEKANGNHSDLLPDHPADMQLWFRGAVNRMKPLPWSDDVRNKNAQDLAISLKKYGISDNKQRTRIYQLLTDKVSGKDMDPRELYLLQANASQAGVEKMLALVEWADELDQRKLV
jgi:hypothetical protein